MCETIKQEFTTKDKDISQFIAEDRYATIAKLLKLCMQKVELNKIPLSDRLDNILLNRVLAFPIFAVIMYLVYYISVTWLGAIVTDWTNDSLFGEMIIPWAQEFLKANNCPEILTSLISDGIIGGVGAVLGFVPQMLILFFLLSILEECGYMTRAAFILDRIFRFCGLSGRAFIPYLIGSGCGVPALMTARTLSTESERRLTLFTTTMIPCGAKLPVIIIFANFVFKDSLPNFAPSMYLLAIFLVIISAKMLSKFATFKPSLAPLMLELPLYHLPSARVVLFTVYHRAKAFIIKAGTVIFLSVTVIWALSTFGYQADKGVVMVEDPEQSFLADVAKPVSPVFIPLGFNDYRATVSIVAGLVAKENIISSMATISGIDEEDDKSANTFATTIAGPDGMFKGDLAAVLAFVMFNLFTIPCLAAVGVLKRELGSNRLFYTAIAYQIAFSYAVSMITYQAITFYHTQQMTLWAGVAGALVILILFLLVRPAPQQQKSQEIDFKFIKD